jgi:AAA family ATP:ADP antiporter
MITANGLSNKTAAAVRQRALILFVNFLLIILAYYQVKSASRSLLIEHWGAEHFPYVWIASAVILGIFIGLYHHLVQRYSRLRVVLGSCLLFISLLILFRVMLESMSAVAAIGFYIFVDIFSVILVEQFWSLTNTITEAENGRRSYWFVGTGGLVGGVLGGVLAASLLHYTPMTTADLLISCAVLLVIVFGLNMVMGRVGLYEEIKTIGGPAQMANGWRALVQSRYLILIAAVLLCAQLVQPLVEYQFIKSVEAAYHDLDQRTVFISTFFSVLGIVSIGINLLITPIIHRYLGVMAGLLTQPLILAICSLSFIAIPTLMMASVVKISDRGLSYSVNRASKELLYIPIDPVRTYQAKAWIDMLGYRLFKILGSALILLFTQWLPFSLDVSHLGWITVVVCASWVAIIGMLAREYRVVAPIAVAA